MLETRALGFHLLGFYNALKAKGRKRKTAGQTVRRVIAVCRGTGFRHLPGVTPGKVEAFLSRIRNDGIGITAQTYNHDVRNIGQACRWTVHTGRAERNPPLSVDDSKPFTVALSGGRTPKNTDLIRWIDECPIDLSEPLEADILAMISQSSRE